MLSTFSDKYRQLDSIELPPNNPGSSGHQVGETLENNWDRQIVSIQDRIRTVESLPSPPNVAVQIVQLCQDASSSLQELTQVLSLDPALAARVLRVSNSAAYARGREVTSLAQAITTLGAGPISIVALGFSLKAAIPVGSTTQGSAIRHSGVTASQPPFHLATGSTVSLW